ncbi:hypothetical protein T484DRAFT_1797405, partial [Baffinella frigidus]
GQQQQMNAQPSMFASSPNAAYHHQQQQMMRGSFHSYQEASDQRPTYFNNQEAMV